MPKRVNHDRRRDEIALVACRVVASGGFSRSVAVETRSGVLDLAAGQTLRAGAVTLAASGVT